MLERLAAGPELWADLRQLTPRLGNQPGPGYFGAWNGSVRIGGTAGAARWARSLARLPRSFGRAGVAGPAGCLRGDRGSRPRRLRRGVSRHLTRHWAARWRSRCWLLSLPRAPRPEAVLPARRGRPPRSSMRTSWRFTRWIRGRTCRISSCRISRVNRCKSESIETGRWI